MTNNICREVSIFNQQYSHFIIQVLTKQINSNCWRFTKCQFQLFQQLYSGDMDVKSNLIDFSNQLQLMKSSWFPEEGKWNLELNKKKLLWFYEKKISISKELLAKVLEMWFILHMKWSQSWKKQSTKEWIIAVSFLLLTSIIHIYFH